MLVVLSPDYCSSWWCLEELRICTSERREAVLPVFYDVQPGDYDAALLVRSEKEMRADLPSTPRDTKQQWVDALSWVRGVSGVTGWVHSSAKECAAVPEFGLGLCCNCIPASKQAGTQEIRLARPAAQL